MAHIAQGQYNFGTIQTHRTPQISRIYAQVGQQLNQMYLQARQMRIQSISNPLSQMKANADDQALLDEERSLIESRFKEFEENDNWHRALPMIFNTVEDIMGNEALKKITEKYQQRQAYIQGVNESEWTEDVKFMLINGSDIDSQQVVYDRDNNKVVSGSYNGRVYSDPIDAFEYMTKIADITSKLPESGVSYENIISDPRRLQGLAQMFEMDGELFVSNYLKSGYAQEGVSRESIMRFSQSLLAEDPKVKNYYTTIAKAQMFKKQYVPDKNNPRGGTMLEPTPEMLADVFNESRILNALPGAGISLNDVGSLNKDGTFTINPEMSEDTKNKLTAISYAAGFDIIGYLSKGRTDANIGTDANTLEEFIGDSFHLHIEDLFDKYLQSNNISPNDPNMGFYKQSWYEAMYTQNAVKGSIANVSNSIADVMAWQKTKTTMDLLPQSSYGVAMTERYRRQAEERKYYQEYDAPWGSVAPDIEVTSDNTRFQQEEQIALGEQIATAENAMKEIAIETDIYNKLSKQGVKVTPGNIEELLSLDFNSIINDPKYKLTDEEKIKIQELGYHKRLIKDAEGKKESFSLTITKAYDILRDTPHFTLETGLESAIIENQLYTYEDYLAKREEFKEYANNRNINGDKFPILHKVDQKLKSWDWATQDWTKEEFNRIQQKLLNRANKLSIKKGDGSLTFTSKGLIMDNVSQFTEKYRLQAIDAIVSNGDGWLLEQFSGKKLSKNIGTSLASDPELRSLFTLYAPRNKDGVISQFDKKGVSSKETGFIDDTYSVDYKVYYDPSDIARPGERKFKMKAIFKNAQNEVIGDAVVSRPISERQYMQMIQNDWNDIRTYQTFNPKVRGESVYAESAGKLAAQATQALYNFNTVDGVNTTTAGTIFDIERRASQLQNVAGNEIGSETLYTSFEPYIPYNNQELGNFHIQIKKSHQYNGQPGYSVALVKLDEQGNWEDASQWKNSAKQVIKEFPGLTLGNNFVYSSVTEALAPLTSYILDLGYTVSDAHRQYYIDQYNSQPQRQSESYSRSISIRD